MDSLSNAYDGILKNTLPKLRKVAIKKC